MGANDAMDFEKKLYTAAYHRLCDFVSPDGYEGPPIDYESFATYCCLHCFDMSPTSPQHQQLKKQGTTQVRLRMSLPLPHGVILVALIETQDQLDIDFARNINPER